MDIPIVIRIGGRPPKRRLLLLSRTIGASGSRSSDSYTFFVTYIRHRIGHHRPVYTV